MRARYLCALGAILFAGGLLGGGPAVASPQRAADTAEPAAIDMVVLVDQSGSLTDQDVARERSAVGTIAQSGLNSQSRVSVIGFGSNNGRPGQVAVTEFCRPTVLDDDVARQYLADCSNRIVRRTPEQGNDTDHAAALAQAVATLERDSAGLSHKAVFLLTDGRLDVRNSPNYGKDASAADRDRAATVELNRQLDQARSAGIQLWPLGFGRDIDQSTLSAWAAAAGRNPDCVQPTARVVTDSADVQQTLLDVYASAICAKTEPPAKGTLPTDLSVEISPLATDGTIIVSKSDPLVKVTYLDPSGAEVDGPKGDSTFDRSGANTPTESLHIRNPEPGRWTVKLEAPERAKGRPVSASVLWQGAIRSSIVVDPPSARPGEKVTVRMALLTRTGQITDPDLLRGLNVGVTAHPQAEGSSAAPVTMTDDGRGADQQAADGTFTGTWTVPAANGTVAFTGVVNGPGVFAQNLPTTVQVAAVATTPVARLDFDAPDEIWAGRNVPGHLSIDNPGAARTARLEITDGAAGVRLALTPAGSIPVPSGHSERDVTLAVQPGSRTGATALTVRLTDTADNAVYGNALVNFEVRSAPGWVERHRALIVVVLVALLLALLALLVLRQRRRYLTDVRQLRAVLRSTDDRVNFTLKAQRVWSNQFRFALRQDGDLGPRLEWPQPGEPVYVARRAGRGRVRVSTPDGQSLNLTSGGGSEPVTGNLLLGFVDDRLRQGKNGNNGLGTPEPATTGPFGDGPDPSYLSDPFDGPTPVGDPFGGPGSSGGFAPAPTGDPFATAPAGSGGDHGYAEPARTGSGYDDLGYGGSGYGGAGYESQPTPGPGPDGRGQDAFASAGDPFAADPGGGDPFAGDSFSSDPFGGDPFGEGAEKRPGGSPGPRPAAPADQQDPWF